MAQAPQGKPRSAPGPAASQMRPPAPPLTGLSSPFERDFDFRRQGASLRQNVVIGGQTYRGMDNGRATVLVPVHDPLRPPELLAQQRKAVVNALFMAQNPIAGAAYGVATLAGASPRTRDRALIIGGIADAVSGASVPRLRQGGQRGDVRKGATEIPQDGAIRYREANAAGQSQGVNMALGAPMLGTGGETKRRVRPPGFISGKPPYNHDRAHLAGKQLGGHADELKKVFAATRRTNSPIMRDIENGIAQRVASGELIDYSVTPYYHPGVPAPAFVTITAWGDREGPKAFIIENPLGRRPK